MNASAIFGPRIPRTLLRTQGFRYAIPTGLLLIVAALLVVSYFMPYWAMTLHAPQYPGGLHVTAHLHQLEGDVAEIDGLNHYIGMRPLEEAAQLERQTSWMLVAVVALLLLGAIFIHSPLAALAVLPAVIFPIGFLVDLHLWLDHFGQNLDPTAALSSSIKPFTPPVLGEGMVGQFRTVAVPQSGLILAGVGSLLTIVALWFHRRAYKPLLDQRRADQKAKSKSTTKSKAKCGRCANHRAKGEAS